MIVVSLRWMNNPRITNKERGLIKGSLRRVFSRSELRQQVVAASRIEYHDPNRPRVKKWSRCELCKELTPTYLIAADHILPLIPLNSSLNEMSWDELVDRLWCDASNLQAVCVTCHKAKSKQEMKQRALFKKANKLKAA